MAGQEAEKDLLEELAGVTEELEAHTERLKALAQNPEVTAQQCMGELSDTFLSLFKDFAGTATDALIEMRQYLHEEVEPALQDIEGGVDESVLLKEDAELIGNALQILRTMLDGAKSATKDPQQVAEVDRMQAVAERAWARVAEITVDEEDDDDSDDEEEGPEPN